MQRILCIFGTRPEAIKMAPVIHALAARREVEVITCDTGQHREMSAPVLRWFGIRPRFRLDLMSHNQTLSHFFARALVSLDDLLARCHPDIVVCQGDTSTAAAAGLAAFHRKIGLAHVEAGLRTGNREAPWPEEINRRIIDLVADFYFAPTRSAAQALRREGVPASRIHLTGNTGIDALLWTLRRLADAGPLAPRSWPPALRPLVASSRHAKVPAREFVLITCHRRESFGAAMKEIAAAIAGLAVKFPDTDWVFPVHLNPNVRTVMHRVLDSLPNVKLMEPLDYPRFCWLCSQAAFILTDSGGIQEEAPVLGKPVLVMRDTTERPEGVKAGVARLVGNSTAGIVREASRLLTRAAWRRRMGRKLNLYGDGKASQRIAQILARTAKF